MKSSRLLTLILIVTVCFALNGIALAANETLMQGFYWETPKDPALWTEYALKAKELADAGITMLWIPPAYKGMAGNTSVGYEPYDYYDLGEFNQNGDYRTKYGTKAQLDVAVTALQTNGIKVIADMVMNHMVGGDKLEIPTGSWNYAGKQVYTGFTFPGRGTTYSSFKWSWSNFNGLNYVKDVGDVSPTLLPGKQPDDIFGGANWGTEYLMGDDIDYENADSRSQMKIWGVWLTNTLKLDGYRIDASKHMSSSFLREWLDYTRAQTGKSLWAVGEAWIDNVDTMKSCLADVQYKMNLFDFPLHVWYRSNQGGPDFSQLRYQGLVGSDKGDYAVTFADNHDTSRVNNPNGDLSISTNKEFLYAYILTLDKGVPCVWYKDYYTFNMKPVLDPMLKARKDYAYGTAYYGPAGSEYYTYVRQGTTAQNGLVLVMSRGAAWSGNIDAKKANTTYTDIMGNNSGVTVTTDASGIGYFKTPAGKVSIWVPTMVTVPAAPATLTATASGTTINLSWAASSGASSYTIYRATSSTGTYSSIGTPTGTTYADTGLTAGTTYYYKVTAANSVGTSDYSPVASATTGTIPAAPATLTATASGTIINLSWAASSGATSYTVYRATSSTGTYSSIGTPIGTAYSDTGLTATTTYYYKVTATNSAGTSGYSPVVSATTETPTGLKVHFKNNSITNWSTFNCYYWGSNGSPASNTWPGASMTSEGNNWYCFVIPGSTSSNIIFNNGSSQTVDLSRTTEGWFVPTGTSSGKIVGTWSNSNPDTPTVPAAPSTLTATASGTTINLSWAASSGATSYAVYRATSSTGTYSSIGTPTGTTYADSGLTAGTTYYYKVTATNSIGTSDYSPVASATTGTVPAAPATLTATASGTAINLSWAASSGATLYTVYRATSSTGTYSLIGTPTGTTYADTGLTAATTYYYKVTANNSVGTSGYSPVASATTDSTVTTTIKVVYNCGYGNSIYIRGGISPLSWTAGKVATWSTGNVWVYTTTSVPAGTTFEYKALINDSTWSDGANYVGTGGQTMIITPTFTGNFYDVMDSLTNWTVSGYTGAGKWHANNYMAKAYGCTSESVLTLTPSLKKLGTVTLAFKYQVTGLDTGEYLAVDAYNGSVWTQVGSYTGTVAATNVSIDVTKYASSNFKVRFRTKMSDATEYSYVDNVSIKASVP